MKIEITLDTARLHWLGFLGVALACASCVPSPRSAGSLAMPATLQATALPTEADLSTEEREQVSQKVAELLVPVSSSPAAPFVDSSRTPEDRKRSLNCLTQAIYYEARSESEDGQRAVAQVVLNRVRHPAFPSNVCGVVFQGHERSTGCQFSFTCDGSMRGRREPAAWMQARRVAEQALAGSVYQPVGNATHYHTTAIRPYWAAQLRESAVVGSHIFYRWAGNAGEASAFRQRHGGLEPSPDLWQGASSFGGVTIHRGLTPDEAAADPGNSEQAAQAEPSSTSSREEVALDGGRSVTIHRGARLDAGPVHIEVAPRRQAARENGAAGVKVHVGAPPNLG